MINHISRPGINPHLTPPVLRRMRELTSEQWWDPVSFDWNEICDELTALVQQEVASGNIAAGEEILHLARIAWGEAENRGSESRPLDWAVYERLLQAKLVVDSLTG